MLEWLLVDHEAWYNRAHLIKKKMSYAMLELMQY